MKKQHIAFLGGAALVLCFMLAAHLYKNQRAHGMESMAQALTAPLVRDYSQSKGSSDARVVIVEFFDPGCEACKIFAQHIDDLMATHAGKVRLVLRYAPFHKGADTMVKILEAARRQGKYFETLKVMFDTQAQWASHHHPQPEKIWDFLPAAGLNVEEIRSSINDPEFQAIIDQDIADAKTLNVRQTPTFFVNGKSLPSFGLSQLQTLVNEEVARYY